MTDARSSRPPGPPAEALSRGERRDSKPRPPGPQAERSGACRCWCGLPARFELRPVALGCAQSRPRVGLRWLRSNTADLPGFLRTLYSDAPLRLSRSNRVRSRMESSSQRIAAAFPHGSRSEPDPERAPADARVSSRLSSRGRRRGRSHPDGRRSGQDGCRGPRYEHRCARRSPGAPQSRACRSRPHRGKSMRVELGRCSDLSGSRWGSRRRGRRRGEVEPQGSTRRELPAVGWPYAAPIRTRVTTRR